MGITKVNANGVTTNNKESLGAFSPQMHIRDFRICGGEGFALAIASDSRLIIIISSTCSVDYFYKVMAFIYAVACLTICPGQAFRFCATIDRSDYPS